MEERLFAFPPETSKCTDEAFEAARASAVNRFWITGRGDERFRDFSISFFGKIVQSYIKMQTKPIFP